MREKFLSTLHYAMSKLQKDVNTGFFTLESGFDYGNYRKHQWRLYGMIDTAYMLNIIDLDESFKYKNRVRAIGIRYINSLPPVPPT